ncbi:CLUMA_CG002924, isoform A [Clunio marinus]|uniref:CLUMA_CG002924, isoform A n=1 Tax=Clunio marinus TaxID=568069 RepID=A0A1J1HMJ8_9DIPT|nr:CLUMA_CG002924, isoform A [Clunio marinus]
MNYRLTTHSSVIMKCSKFGFVAKPYHDSIHIWMFIAAFDVNYLIYLAIMSSSCSTLCPRK